ncbi:hypothetical protein GCM10008018_29100 [Paenibacillus marchantiophytorum]|uniref:Uncharacterized protein n=1 Tax=Paenibacillus marchantiophytorum TaxID=1619310 RepID=A0ABQ1EQB1_9BACL|nr:hypothetical protein [Paenibacillus marchantiophytorum]GFZ81519.1 hypothetical protein GCM10008018_29100 [Paenibacillus marchantiophytorum]
MTAKIFVGFVCILSLSALGVGATENHSHVVPPYSPELYSSTTQFEYEFEWLHGTILANPQ